MNQAYYEIEENFSHVQQTAIALMRNRGFDDICNVINNTSISVINTEYDNWNNGTYGYTVYLNSSVKLYSSFTAERISKIEKIFSESLNEAIKGDESNYFKVQMSPSFCKDDVDWNIIGGKVEKEKLKNDIETIKNIMVSVSTKGNPINEEDKRYKEIHSRILKSCNKINISYNNRFDGLWDWYRKWKADLPSYQSRRDFLANLFKPTLSYFEDDENSANIDILIPLNNWDRINRTVVKIKKDSSLASNEEDYQVIGLLCREVIISLAQAIYDPSLHGTTDDKGVVISETDAFRMISNYISTSLSGSSLEEIRAYAKTTNKLANALTHKRSATKKDMLLTSSATIALINFIGIINEKYN